MKAFVKLVAIWGSILVAVVVIGVAIIVPVAISNARAADQKTATVAAQQQNAYSLLDTSAGQVAYGYLIDNDWGSFCRHLGVVSNVFTHEGVTSTMIRCVDSADNIVLMSSETSGYVYTIGVCDPQGNYKAIASFEPAEGYTVPINLGSGKPTIYLTPIGAIYLGQTVGHFVSGTYE
jgi:hypothetical protein